MNREAKTLRLMEATESGAQKRPLWPLNRKKQWWRELAQWISALRRDHMPKRLRVIESLQLGEKRQLLVVSVNGRELLIGAAANFLATLADLNAEGRGAAQE